VDAVIATAVQSSGIEQSVLERAARMLAHAVSPVILFGKGLTARRDEKLIEALLALARLTGAVDGERNGLISVKGEANSLAAAQLGLEAQFALNGQQAVYAAIGDDYVSNRLVERLSQSPYLVVQASYASKLTEKADVVLPVALWSEQIGHYLNLDGRLQQAEKAVNAPENVRENSAVLAEVAMRMNMPVKKNWQTALRERSCSIALAETELTQR
jgi:predicted molibdopterin-dependent oxidoreductase YjgC